MVAWKEDEQEALKNFQSLENQTFNIEILSQEELSELTPGMSNVRFKRSVSLTSTLSEETSQSI